MTLEELRAKLVRDGTPPPFDLAIFNQGIALALIDVAIEAKLVLVHDDGISALLALEAALAAQEKGC